MNGVRPSVLARVLAFAADAPYLVDSEIQLLYDALALPPGTVTEDVGPILRKLRFTQHHGPYSVLCADPAWLFDDKLPGATRGANKQYREQHVDDIVNRRKFEFDWPKLAEDCILFLWRVGSQQEEALRVVRGWDFKVKGEIVWNKLTKKGKPWFGMGRIQRQAHETCVVATRGRSANVVVDRGIRSTFSAKVPTYEAGHPKVGQPLLDKHGEPRFDKKGRPMVVKVGDYIHSAKPEEFYTQIVEKMCRGPYVELFARRTRLGWDTRGNEVWDPASGRMLS